MHVIDEIATSPTLLAMTKRKASAVAPVRSVTMGAVLLVTTAERITKVPDAQIVSTLKWEYSIFGSI
jgi:hypothetical protein